MEQPQKGLYYHYKHDPEGPVNNYAYEVLGLGLHTEMHDDENGVMVIYRPLDPEAFVYKKGKLSDVRPLKLFMEKATKDGETVDRFQKITNPEIIAELEKIRDAMYS